MRSRWVGGAAIVLIAAGAIAWRQLGGGEASHGDLASEHGGNGVVAAGKAVVPRAAPAPVKDEVVAGGLRLEGQVIDEHQQPIDGATVVLELAEPRLATTTADGSFAFDGLRAGRYRVHARAGDRAGKAEVRLSATSDPAIVRMRRGDTLVVHVVDDRGPVANAEVTLWRDLPVRTNADGVATFAGVRAGEFFDMIEAKADGYAPSRLTITLSDDPGAFVERTIKLTRGAPLGGTVVGPDGAPVPHAHVAVASASRRGDSDGAIADDKGAWHVDAVGAGKYTLTATSEVYGPARGVELAVDGTTPRRDIVLHVAVDAQLVGTVVDAAGAPVTGATVLFGTGMGGGTTHRSDATGHFEVLGFPAGKHEVMAYEGTRASPVAEIEVGEDERVEVRLVLQEAAIAGVVVDERGEPVAEANVKALPAHGMTLSYNNNDTTDSHGRFAMTGIASGEYDVSAIRAEQSIRAYGGTRLHTGTTDARIVLPASATLTARVTLDGAPVPYFGVMLSTSGAPIGQAKGIRDPDGRLALHDLSVQTTSVIVAAPGAAQRVIKGVKLEAGKTTDLGDIALAHGQRVAGHVYDTSHAPVAGARVALGMPMPVEIDQDALLAMFRGTYEATTDAQGAFAFDGVTPNARDKLSATHPTLGASAALDLPTGDATVDLVLAGAGGIDGLVEGFTDMLGAVTARGGSGTTPRIADVDRAGMFHFDNVVPGDYTLAVSAAARQGRAAARHRDGRRRRAHDREARDRDHGADAGGQGRGRVPARRDAVGGGCVRRHAELRRRRGDVRDRVAGRLQGVRR